MKEEDLSITVVINDVQFVFDRCYTVIQACKIVGIDIPHFCYHDKLKIAGNCRMCLVEVEGFAQKPVPSCVMTICDSMVIRTNTKIVQDARNGVVEFLLLNHPLDCPVCDQGGECELQDQSIAYGKNVGKFCESKRVVSKKYFSPVIDLHMTRCIHCTRCVRFMEDIAGEPDLGLIGRGVDAEISTMLSRSIRSELSGNIIDLCPVGALTSRPYAATARSWELKKTKSIDVMDGVGSAIRIDSKNDEVMRIVPICNDEINDEWITDKIRFSYDGLKVQRLDRPYISSKFEKRQGQQHYERFKEVNWRHLYKSVAEILKSTDPSNIAFLIGDLVDCETIYALKNLASILNIEKIESRCDGSFIPTRNRWFYCFNTGIKNIEQADLFILIATNPKVDAPIINAKIYQNVVLNGTKVFFIGEQTSNHLNYPFEYIGDSLSDISNILNISDKICKALKNAEKPMFIVGSDIFSFGEQVGLENVFHMIIKKFKLMRNDWLGFNMLHKVANRVGAFDLKFLPKNEEYNIFLDKAIKVLYLVGCDDLEEGFLEDKFIIYQGHHGVSIAQYANILIPVPAFTEKTSTYVNTEGRAQIASQAVSKLYMSKEDCEVINSIIKNLDIEDDIVEKLEKYKSDESRLNMYDINLAKVSPIFANIGNRIVNDFKQTDLYIKKDNLVLSNAKIVMDKRNFYLTNSITKFSKVMAECVYEYKEEDCI